MRTAILAMVVMLCCAATATAWEAPPPECTVEQVGDLALATPRIWSPRDGRFVPLDADGTTVPVHAEAGATDSGFPTSPDLLILEVRRPGGKVVGTFGDQEGSGEILGDWNPPAVERFYVVSALAVYDLYSSSPCSLESGEATFMVIRRAIGVSQLKGRLLGLLGRFQRNIRGASSGADLGFAADAMDEDLAALSVVRLRSDAATRSLDSWIVYARRFTATIRGLGVVLGQYRIPGPKRLAKLRVRGAELRRATNRLVREVRRHSGVRPTAPRVGA